MLAQNPDTAGFGLADTQGNLLLTSSNLRKSNFPNLKDKPETAASFRKALSKDGMILGRTDHMKAADRWLIPARFRLTDENHNAIAVMTTSFNYNAENSSWNDKDLPESVILAIIRKDGEQFYRQYISGIEKSDYYF